MPITNRSAGRPAVKRNVASLVGGFVIAGGCFVLFVLVASQLLPASYLSAPMLLAAFVFAAIVGVYIRLADL